MENKNDVGDAEKNNKIIRGSMKSSKYPQRSRKNEVHIIRNPKMKKMSCLKCTCTMCRPAFEFQNRKTQRKSQSKKSIQK